MTINPSPTKGKCDQRDRNRESKFTGDLEGDQHWAFWFRHIDGNVVLSTKKPTLDYNF
jgi:hypothetical protein